jgi:hypothetical protein
MTQGSREAVKLPNHNGLKAAHDQFRCFKGSLINTTVLLYQSLSFGAQFSASQSRSYRLTPLCARQLRVETFRIATIQQLCRAGSPIATWPAQRSRFRHHDDGER